MQTVAHLRQIPQPSQRHRKARQTENHPQPNAANPPKPKSGSVRATSFDPGAPLDQTPLRRAKSLDGAPVVIGDHDSDDFVAP